MPPVTPRRMRAIGADPPVAPGSGAVLVADLARGELLERDREVVAGGCVDHRWRELLVAALAEGPVVAVQLTGALGRDEHGGIVRVGSVEKLVYAGLDHQGPNTRGRPPARFARSVPAQMPRARSRRSRPRDGTPPGRPARARRSAGAGRSARWNPSLDPVAARAGSRVRAGR